MQVVKFGFVVIRHHFRLNGPAVLPSAAVRTSHQSKSDKSTGNPSTTTSTGSLLSNSKQKLQTSHSFAHFAGIQFIDFDQKIDHECSSINLPFRVDGSVHHRLDPRPTTISSTKDRNLRNWKSTRTEFLLFAIEAIGSGLLCPPNHSGMCCCFRHKIESRSRTFFSAHLFNY